MKKLHLITLAAILSLCTAQEIPDSYMEAYKASHLLDNPSGKQDSMYGMANFDFQMAALGPIFKVLTTIAKIILKITLFKMIVKFVAIICLLFFIPWLKFPDLGHSDSKGESRRMNVQILSEQLEKSLKKYSQ